MGASLSLALSACTARYHMPSTYARHWTTCRNATMVPPYNALLAYNAVRRVNKQRIPGDIVEAGVWAGGVSCFMAKAQRYGTMARRHWLYDTYEGMPQPTQEDDRRSRRLWRLVTNGSIAPRSVPGPVRDKRWSYAPLEDVRQTMRRAASEASVFVKGKVEETLRSGAHQLPSQIAVLRLDTDWYASTKAELELLWPRLSPGGWLYIDDYGSFAGARKAVDQWLEANGWTRQAHEARAFKTGRVNPKDVGDDQQGSFHVMKSRPFNASRPFDLSSESVWALHRMAHAGHASSS